MARPSAQTQLERAGVGSHQKRWRVSVTQTIDVLARNEEEAEFLAQEWIDGFGPETSDTQVEELEY